MIRRRDGLGLVLILLLGSGLAVAIAAQTSFFGRIGPRPDGTGIVPNHWMLTPVGLQVEVGDRPLGIAATPDGRYLVVSNNGQGVQVLPYGSPEALFLGVVVAPDGRRVYASGGGNNKVRVYDFDGRALTERAPISLGDSKARIFPAGLAVSADGATLYVALNLENAVAFVDPVTGQVRSRVTLAPSAKPEDLGSLPYAVVVAGTKLYVSVWNGGGVSVIDTTQAKLLRRIATGGHASSLALSPNGDRLYVANATSDTVSVIDTSSDTVVGAVDLRPYPDAP